MAATAYAALVSLLNNLDLIQHHPRHSFSFDNKQIESLLESVLFLIHFMETTDFHGGAAEDLERQIACAAHAAGDVIESHVVDQITGGSTLGGKATPSCFLPDLQKAIEDMEFVWRKAIKAPKSQSGFKAEQPISSATNLSSQRNTMVGFDKALHQLLGLLTGEANGRRVIPIVGMGGIGTFEEDERVSAATLVKLWIGEGFLKPSKAHSLEEVAEGYLKDLVDRNLIVACKRDLNGKIVSCEIHDIVRELCLKIVEKEEFLCVVDAPGAIDRERRVVIRGRNSYKMLARVL